MFIGGHAAELNFKHLPFFIAQLITFKNFNLGYMIVRLVFLIPNYTKYIWKKFEQ